MKLKKRLSDLEANYIGLKLRKLAPSEKWGNPKYQLTKEQFIEIQEIRNNGILKSCENLEVDPTTVKHLWKKTKDESLFVKNPLYKEQLERDFESLKDDLINSLKSYTPTFNKIKREKNTEGHLLIIDIADLHINKYCESFLTGSEYNSNIAVQRAIEGTEGIIKKANGFEIDKILFVIGNDVLNTDNISKTTTKGTQQDTEVHWFKAFQIALKCYVSCIDLCLKYADVDVIHCPSNHDFMSGCFLAETLSSWYRSCENITFNTSPRYRKYYQYYNNLIELEHGDKGSISKLPLTIAQEEPQMWANTQFRYGYLHHVHHSDINVFKSSKDNIGVNITYLRSPSPADIWHHDNQYLNILAIEGFVHSKNNGRVAHLTHYF